MTVIREIINGRWRIGLLRKPCFAIGSFFYDCRQYYVDFWFFYLCIETCDME